MHDGYWNTADLDTRRFSGYSHAVRRALTLILTAALSAGCGLLSGGGAASSSKNAEVTQGVRSQLEGKRVIALVYESVNKPDGLGGKESVFRFQQSALLDQALVDLKMTVSDRGTIHSIIESQRLPESGSFKSEDLTNIGKASGADILLVGLYSSVKKEGIVRATFEHKMILRAVNLKTLEVINSVQSEATGDAAWRRLTYELFRQR